MAYIFVDSFENGPLGNGSGTISLQREPVCMLCKKRSAERLIQGVAFAVLPGQHTETQYTGPMHLSCARTLARRYVLPDENGCISESQLIDPVTLTQSPD
jgi:hypothetical protein